MMKTRNGLIVIVSALLLGVVENCFTMDTVTVPLQKFGYGKLLCTALSPDGTKFLTGSGDDNVRLWDVSTAQVIQTFSGHRTVVYAVAFSPDCSKILTGSWDGTALLWDVSDILAIRPNVNTCTRSSIHLLSATHNNLKFSSLPKNIFSPGSILSIYQLNGRCTARFPINLKMSFHLQQSLGTGVYLYNFTGINNSAITGRFIINN